MYIKYKTHKISAIATKGVKMGHVGIRHTYAKSALKLF